MDKSRRTQFKEWGIGVALFGLLSLPAFFVQHPKTEAKVTLQYPKQARQLASTGKSTADVAQRQCELDWRWRYRCDENQKNCVKDRKESYLKCKTL